MKRIFCTVVIVSTIIFSFCFTSCNTIRGNGEIVKIEQQLSQFDKISSNDAFDVIIYYSDTYKVIVEAESNLLPYILTTVNDHKLTIRTKSNIIFNSYKNVKVHVYCKTVEDINNNGSGNIYADEIITSDDLEIAVRGSGNIEIDNISQCNDLDLKVTGSGNLKINYVDHCKDCDISINGSGGCSINDFSNDDLEVSINGSGGVNLAGSSYFATLKINGSGKYNSYDLRTNIYDIRINGSGNSYITVTDKLIVKINGSGDVYYKGSPLMEVTGGGSGKVISKN
ncbi:MAG: DUF2807 domain-containing protein [Bacteroidales bacterium]|jgi:predicted small secreted protein|nr:DUF2807 domain-containing protein [Bacteroidales bacterium]